MKKINHYIYTLQRKVNKYPLRLLYNPLVIQLDITTKCNLACPNCPRTVLSEDDRDKDMSLDSFQKISPFLSSVKDLCLFGVGEPLMSSLFWPVLKLMYERRIPVHFQTNGLLLTEADIIKLVELKVRGIIFSIDAVEEEIFKKIRSGGELSKVVENIKLINKIKKDKNSVFPELGICFTCQKDNIDQIPKTIEFSHEVGIKSVSFQNMIAYNPTSAQKVPYLTEEKLIAEKFMLAKKNADKLGIKIHRTPKFHPEEEFCEFPWYFLYFRWDGKVSPCCYFQYKYLYQYIMNKDKLIQKEIELEPFIIGDINKQSFSEIWNGEKIQLLRKSIKTKQFLYHCNICLVRYGLH